MKHRAPMTRINLSISQNVLEMVDTAAKHDFTTRSDVIRMAILWYLRPQGRDFAEADADEILHMLQRRKFKAALRKSIREEADED